MSAPTTSFYVTGGTLRHDTPCYVERRADTDLYEGLAGGEFCYVLTSRQMGKSSLMNHTAARLREAGVAVVLLDLTAIGQNLTAEQWYGGLIERLGYQIDLEDKLDDFWDEHERLGPLQRFMAAIREVVLPALGAPGGSKVERLEGSQVERPPASQPSNLPGTGPAASRPPPSNLQPAAGRLVIFIDEIDTVRSITFPTDELFAAIRECYNRRTEEEAFERLTFCLLGVATPSDLIRDTRMTPFNIGRRIDLTDFTEAEAAPLRSGLVLGSAEMSGREEGVAQTLLNRILHWTGGHPYLTQRLCRAVAEDPAVKDAIGVDRHCSALFLASSARERDDNLIFVRERLLRSEADLASLLELYGTVRTRKAVPPDDANPLVDLLHLSGVTRVTDERRRTNDQLRTLLSRVVGRSSFVVRRSSLVVRNRIYAHVFDPRWVAANMPDAELQRQKAAYRRGVLRAATIAAIIVTAMGLLTYRAVQSDRRAKRAQLRERQQRLQAVAAREEAQQRVVALHVATGNRLVDEGDLIGSLPWFAEALCLEEGKGAREVVQRMRLGAVLQQCPRLLHVLHHNALEWIAEFSPDGSRIVTASYDNTARVWDAATGRPITPPLKHQKGVQHAQFSPDGRRVVTASFDKTARVWDAVSGRPITPPLKHNGLVWHAAFSPDGCRVVTACVDGTAQVWDATSGQSLLTLKHTGGVHHAEFSPDGRRVLTASGDGTARVWDAATGRPITPPLKHNAVGGYGVWRAEFSPDGRRVVTASDNGTARVWDAATGRPITPLLKHDGFVWDAEFSPDGRRVVTASGDSTARVWDAATGQPITPPLKHTGLVEHAAFSRDGRRVVTASYDNTARVWDAASGRPIMPPLKHTGPVLHAAFSPDGRRVVTTSVDKTVRVWEAATGEPITPPLKHDGRGRVWHAEFSRNGRRVVTASDDHTARVWDAASGRPITPPLKHNAEVWDARFSLDGRRIVTASLDRTARVWDAATGRPITPPLRHNDHVWRAEFSPDGRRIVTASKDHTARVWDAATGRPITPPLKHKGWVHTARFSPDGRRIVTASDGTTGDGTGSGEARVWDAATGRPITPPIEDTGQVFDAEFSPDGRHVVTAGKAHAAKVWDAATGRPIGAPLQHNDQVFTAVFSPDGRRVVTACMDQTARVWDAATGQPICPPLKHTGGLEYAEFSPDGRRIVTASWDQTARVWDAATGQPISPPLKHDGMVLRAEFSPDGRRVVTAGDDGTARVWDLPADPRPSADLRRLAQWLAGYRIDASAGSVPFEAAAARREGLALRVKYPAEFAASATQVLTWREREAEDAEQAHEWAAALPHLDALIAAKPAQAGLHTRRGTAHAELGQWKQAVADFGQAADRAPDDVQIRSSQALALLAAGDTSGYQRRCSAMFDRFGRSESLAGADAVVRACVVASGGVTDAARLVAPAERAVAVDPQMTPLGALSWKHPRFLTTLGASLYRAGRLQEAVELLAAQSAHVPEGEEAVRWLFLAMAHARLGHAAEARKWREKATAWMEPGLQQKPWEKPLPWDQRLILQRLRREAEALIHPGGPQ